MTKQEYYNLLVDSARNGNFPATEPGPLGPRCKYRTPDGKKCAAGHLIPDHKYSPDMENRMAVSLRIVAAMEIPEGMNAWDVRWVQSAHDSQASCVNKPWDAQKFITAINDLLCFSDVVRVTP